MNFCSASLLWEPNRLFLVSLLSEASTILFLHKMRTKHKKYKLGGNIVHANLLFNCLPLHINHKVCFSLQDFIHYSVKEKNDYICCECYSYLPSAVRGSRLIISGPIPRHCVFPLVEEIILCSPQSSFYWQFEPFFWASWMVSIQLAWR